MWRTLVVLFMLLSVTPTLGEEPVILRTYNDAYKLMQQHNAPGIFVFHARWCEPCRQMKRDTWEPLMIQLKQKGYVVYFVDTDVETEVVKQWQDKGRLNSIPAYAIASRGAKYLVAYGQGYRNQRDFITWLNEAVKVWRERGIQNKVVIPNHIK